MASVEEVRMLLATAGEKLPFGPVAQARDDLGEATVILHQVISGTSDSTVQQAAGMAAQLDEELHRCLQMIQGIAQAIDEYSARL